MFIIILWQLADFVLTINEPHTTYVSTCIVSLYSEKIFIIFQTIRKTEIGGTLNWSKNQKPLQTIKEQSVCLLYQLF